MVQTGGPALLTAAQAAAHLDVKIETLYAYVSRGQITRRRTPAGSQFDPLELERFSQARRRSTTGHASRVSTTAGSPLSVIDTDVALIEDDELYFRGVRAVELASSKTFEAAAGLVLNRPQDAEQRFEGDERSVDAARKVLLAMPPTAGVRDLLQVAVTVLGTCDVLRATADPAGVQRVAPQLIGGLVDCLRGPDNDSTPRQLAERLWISVSPLTPDHSRVSLLDSALTLLIDHDLAVSTLAARAAASARATPYAVVATGLAALDSDLHGRSSRACHRLLRAVMSGTNPEKALAGVMLENEYVLPGFGHPLYSGWDPRARHLLERLMRSGVSDEVGSAVLAVVETVEARTGLHPNVDLALAAIAAAGEMPGTAAEGIFGVARSVGWLAHAMDEYTKEPMRLRPTGRYVGR